MVKTELQAQGDRCQSRAGSAAERRARERASGPGCREKDVSAIFYKGKLKLVKGDCFFLKRQNLFLPDIARSFMSKRAGGRQSDTVNSHQDGRVALHLMVCHSVADLAGNG